MGAPRETQSGLLPYVVKVLTHHGAVVFEGTVSEVGDFVHLESYPTGRVATIRVHDRMATVENT